MILALWKGTFADVSDSPIHTDSMPAKKTFGGAPPRVLIFDSGVGGLSVLREVAALLPSVSLTYAADNAAFPYGLKPEGELVARVSSVVGRLVERVAPDVVVIACNTASTTALEAVRSFLDIPVIGVVPAIKPAAAASLTRTIALLGTQTTVATAYTGALIAEFAAGCSVLTCAASELVEAAELKMQGDEIDPRLIATVLKRLFDMEGGDNIDTVVLGCTHFPLLAGELAAAAPRAVAWMDSGAAIARRVATILGTQGRGAALCEHKAIFTARTGAVERMRVGLGRFGLSEIGFLTI